MFPRVHVESKKPYGFRPFPPRFTARVQDFLRVNSSIVSERSALSNSDSFLRDDVFAKTEKVGSEILVRELDELRSLFINIPRPHFIPIEGNQASR